MQGDKLLKIFSTPVSGLGPLALALQARRRAAAGLVFTGLALAAVFSGLAQERDPLTLHDGAASKPALNAAKETGPAAQESASPPKQQKPVAADSERKKQIADESTQLLAMALSLKAEVDKTNKDTLSLNVIRKADAIERLAKTVKEKIKQGSGPS